MPQNCSCAIACYYNLLLGLRALSCGLQTNNPRKVNVLMALGVNVTGRLPCIVKAQEFNEGYMATKAARMSHELTGVEGLNGQYCFWNHDGEPMPPLTGSTDNGNSNGNGSSGSLAQRISDAGSPSEQDLDSSDTDCVVFP